MMDKLALVEKLYNKGKTWAEIADAVNATGLGRPTNGEALRKWFSYNQDKLDKGVKKYQEQESKTFLKRKRDLDKEVLKLVRASGGRLSAELLTQSGIKVGRIKEFYPSVTAFMESLYEEYPNYFALSVDTVDHKALYKKIDKCTRVVVTTVVVGAKTDKKILESLESYCKRENAIVIYIPVADPASKVFVNMGSSDSDRLIQGVDRRIVESKYFFPAIGQHIKLAGKLSIANIKTSAKQTDPTTGLARLTNKLGSIIVGSPKQRLVSVPKSRNQYPRFLMTTGAITVPDYTTNNYISMRTAFLSESDHIMGAIIVEKEENSKFHVRQIQFDSRGTFTDLAKKYKPQGPTKTRVEALVMGDWHSGSTAPDVITSTQQMCRMLKPKYLVVHDGFDGMSINHHEKHKRITKSGKASAKLNNLQQEVENYAKDLKFLSGLADAVVIVKSNHDEFLDRYIEEARYMDDPENHAYALKLAAAMAEGVDPLYYGLVNSKIGLASNVIWLDRDEDFYIKGIQLADHGDRGPNGSRGTLANNEASLGKCVIGHSHTPGILRDAWQVGTSTHLDLEYTSGPSSWVQTHCVVHKDGSRQLLNIIKGRWTSRKVRKC